MRRWPWPAPRPCILFDVGPARRAVLGAAALGVAALAVAVPIDAARSNRQRRLLYAGQFASMEARDTKSIQSHERQGLRYPNLIARRDRHARLARRYAEEARWPAIRHVLPIPTPEEFIDR